MRFIDTFAKHRNEPDRSFDAYLNERRLELGEAIADRQKVYLDTKYWLLLRDYRLGRSSNHSVSHLSDLLHDGVASTRIICPISADIFMEIVKQTDGETMRCSAELIDTLSCGVSLLSSEERVRMELLHFMRKHLQGVTSCHSPSVFAWTKLAYTLGLTYPTNTQFAPDEELIIQKAFLDHMWEISLCDMLDVIGMDTLGSMPGMRDMSLDLNKGKIEHAHENRSFEQMFLSELSGVLDALKPVIGEMAAHLYECETGNELAADEILASGDLSMLSNAIYHGFRLNRITTDLPSIRIPATLHAAVRWDLQRKYKANDRHDFHHAEAALSYCDMFLTEKSLKHLLTRPDLALDDLYGCRVISEPCDAVREIETVLASRPN